MIHSFDVLFKECRICAESHSIYHASVACGHVMCCDDCFQQYDPRREKKCWICREDLTELLRIYVVIFLTCVTSNICSNISHMWNNSEDIFSATP